MAKNAVGISLPSVNSAPATPLAPALTPMFWDPDSTADGFIVQISNYDSSYTWAGAATALGSSGSYMHNILNGKGIRPTPRRVTLPRTLRSAVRFTHTPAGSELGAVAPPPESLAGSGEWLW